MKDVIPIICGSSTQIPHMKDVLFTELTPITNSRVARPKPDLFDGVRPQDIDKALHDDDIMYPLIIPTRRKDGPVAPNFFLEVKPQRGGADVMKRQAGYVGAYGARVMHSLQSYCGESVYSGNANAFSCAYHAGTGTLLLYAHHVMVPGSPAIPMAPGDRPTYHMTLIDSWAITGNVHNFRRGAAAFRNIRDLAQQHRCRLVEAANARAREVIASLMLAVGPHMQDDTVSNPDAADHAKELSGSSPQTARGDVSSHSNRARLADVIGQDETDKLLCDLVQEVTSTTKVAMPSMPTPGH
ncbi:hypothetical protein Sste5346_006434 [Sporothrix stenoceras]|uniref:Uncharacterized protein n=1 Tax=Sporothrix stenoceras TaxID=5173 RepID=A0ABR3YZ09_9PEZI